MPQKFGMVTEFSPSYNVINIFIILYYGVDVKLFWYMPIIEN